MSLEPRQPLALDYRQANATAELLPKPPLLSSCGWNGIHLTVFGQPEFETAEHHHAMHAIAYASRNALILPAGEEGSLGKGISPTSSCSVGERWLDGKLERETRNGGEIAIIPAGTPHRCNWNRSVQFMVLAIAPEFLEAIGREWCDRIELVPHFMTARDALIEGIFSSLSDELIAEGIGGTLLIDSLKTALTIHLLRNYCTRSPQKFQPTGGLSPACMKLVTDYIQDNLQQNLQLQEIAAIAQISPYHFLRLFKQSLHLTPHQYILQSRLEKAKMLLLRENASIAEISQRVGFCDQSHFTRAFKRAFGTTPKQFRQHKIE